VRVFFTGVRRDNKAGDMYFGGLEVSRAIAEELIHSLAGWHAVISHQGKGNDEDLTTVGGICYGLWVANHAGLENQFTSNAPFGTKAVSLVGRVVLEIETHEAVIFAID
jgi:hypothetical protein